MPIPRENTLDSTLSFLNEGYKFISNRCRRLRSDAFETRLMLRKAVCVVGEDAARMFYHPGRFTRRRALPPNALLLLQDVGSAQLLDGEAHRHRKHMLMSAVDAQRIAALTELFASHWEAALERWSGMSYLVLQNEAEKLLCAAACAWIGVPLGEAALRQRTQEFSAMINNAGTVGPRNWKGMMLRSRTEDWARSIIIGIRAGHLDIPANSPAVIVATHRDENGALLDVAVAAVELINLLRPVVAVAHYVTFAALAMHDHPEWKEKLQDGGNDSEMECFVQEVRRFYPFFPAIGGRVMEPFEWRGRPFAKDEWVLLDLYGTNHDPRIWGDPQEFRPERFAQWDRSPFSLIPQGGGDHATGHRCGGEQLTIALVGRAAALLAAMRYEVPLQDCRIDLTHMPAVPSSGFLIRNVRADLRTTPNVPRGVIRSGRVPGSHA
jgi:fatty-acid peroxygenase